MRYKSDYVFSIVFMMTFQENFSFLPHGLIFFLLFQCSERNLVNLVSSMVKIQSDNDAMTADTPLDRRSYGVFRLLSTLYLLIHVIATKHDEVTFTLLSYVYAMSHED